MSRGFRAGTVLIVVATIVAAVPGMGLGLAAVADEPLQTGEDGANATGVQMATFASTTAAEANSSVESAMWEAAVNRSEAPAVAVTARADSLERRLADLRNRSQELETARDNGTLPAPAYNARAAAIQARIAGLEAAINRTERTAQRVGVNVSNLDQLRTEARNLTGPEVAAIARNLTSGGPPEDVPGRGPGTDRGPPDDGPGQGPSTDRPGTPGGTQGPGTDEAGSGNETLPGSGNGGPGGTGAGDGSGSGGGPGDGGGPPTDAGPPDGGS